MNHPDMNGKYFCFRGAILAFACSVACGTGCGEAHSTVVSSGGQKEKKDQSEGPTESADGGAPGDWSVDAPLECTITSAQENGQTRWQVKLRNVSAETLTISEPGLGTNLRLMITTTDLPTFQEVFPAGSWEMPPYVQLQPRSELKYDIPGYVLDRSRGGEMYAYYFSNSDSWSGRVRSETVKVDDP